MPVLDIPIEKRLSLLKEKLRFMYTEDEINESINTITKILALKEKKNVVILGHNYMTPDVLYGISDFIGDSFALSQYATQTQADIILFNGVHFMAETAKILNSSKKVLIADLDAGCSLAESITAEDVKQLKSNYPNTPVISYINCSAKVKAESDIICTSGNAVKIIKSFSEDTVIMLPDLYLADNVAKELNKNIIKWNGKCMVHELFTEYDVQQARKTFSNVQVMAHPECKSEITDLADFTGSTSQMEIYLEKAKPSKVLLLTECSMGANLHVNFPEVEFIGTCQTCPHMKKITLDKIYKTLLYEKNEVLVDQSVSILAKNALERMLEIG